MATDSIVKPPSADAKVPLKHSTVIGIVCIVIILMVIGALIAQSKKSTAQAVEVAEEKPLRVVGSEEAIESELKKAAVQPAIPASAPTPVAGKIPGRESNAVAMERNAPAKDDAATAREQLLSSGIMSKSIIADGLDAQERAPDSPSNAKIRSQLDQLNALSAQIESGGAPGSPNDAATRELGAYSKVLQTVQGSQGIPATDQGWLQQLENLKPADALQPKAVKGDYVLAQGMVIPAALLRDLNSGLPGEVTAKTTIDVYDSFQGYNLLIPKGSLLYGQYSSNVSVGQKRLMFAFTRLVLPNRVSFDLPAAKGMDLAGSSGVTGDVDNHFFERFGSALLVSIMSVAVEKDAPAPGFGTSGGAKTAAGQALVEVSRSILDRNKTIGPTITVPAGSRINVQVNRDMVFPTAFKAGK